MGAFSLIVVINLLNSDVMDNAGELLPILKRIVSVGDLQPIVICVEGNIAAGKTNLMTHLKDVLDKEYGKDFVNVVLEPVKEWNDVGGEKLFDLMMKEPKRWSFAFQNYVQLSMFNSHSKATSTASKTTKLYLVERSIHSARYVFVENHKIRKNMEQVEYNVLDEFYHMITEQLDYKLAKVDYFLYLEATPEICLKRLMHRLKTQDASMTQEESRVTLDYLKSLDELYELSMLSREEFRSKVIRIDATPETEQIVKNLVNF